MKLDIVRGATLYADQVCLRLESGATILCDWADVERKDIRLGDTVVIDEVFTDEGPNMKIVRVMLEERPDNALSIPRQNTNRQEWSEPS